MRKILRWWALPGAALIAAAGAGPAAAAAGPSSAAAAQTAVQVCGQGQAVVSPGSMVLTCADNGELATHLHWTTWAKTRATATGDVTWRACAALCADSRKWDSASARVTLTHPVAEPGGKVLFTRLALHVTGPTPAGFKRDLTFSEAPEAAAPAAAAPASATRQAGPAVTPAAASGTLSYADIEGYWDIAGGSTATSGGYTDAQIAAAITGAESSFEPGIIQPGVDYCGAGADRAGWGLWQITCGNSVPAYGTDFQILDPWNNAEAAVSKYDGAGGFSPWSTYTDGAYEQYLQNTAANTSLTDPGEYVQVNSTPSGTPASPAPDPGGTYGPPMPSSGGSWQVSQAASQASGTVDTFYTEGSSLNNGLGHAYYNPGSGWTDGTDMGNGPMGSEPSTVTSSPGTVYTFWEGQAPNHLWYREYTPGNGWGNAQQLSALGSMGGPPEAVAQSNGTVDVFWKGQDDALWHAYYTVNGGWVSKAQDLGGDLASNPAPVVTKAGTIDVFWKDAATGGLEHAFTDAGGTWSAPQSIPGMGQIGDPHATGQPNGTIDVFWEGTSSGLWHAYYTTSGGWTTSPVSMGGTLTSEPDVVSSSQGTVDVFWLDGSTLYREYTYPGGTWSAPVAMTQMGTIGGEMFATSGRNGTIDVFWKGTDGSLWHGWYNSGSGWQGPQNLGGNVQ